MRSPQIWPGGLPWWGPCFPAVPCPRQQGEHSDRTTGVSQETARRGNEEEGPEKRRRGQTRGDEGGDVKVRRKKMGRQSCICLYSVSFMDTNDIHVLIYTI